MIAGDMGREYQRAERLFKKGRYREARELCEVVIRIGVNADTDCQFAIETGGEAARMITKIDQLTGYTLNPESSYYVPKGPGRMKTIMNWIRELWPENKLRAVSLAIICIASAHGDEQSYPVRWTELVPLDAITNIEQKLAAPLVLTGDPDDELELTGWSKGREVISVMVKTGREYVERIKAGFAPRTTYDKAMSSWANNEALCLALIQQAQPSRMSFVHDLSLETITLKDIPFSIMLFTETKPDDYTFGDDCPDPVIEDRKAHQLAWHCLYDPNERLSTWSYRFEIMAWGDFNADGIEDVLCSYMYNFVYGSNREYYMVVLTKRSADDRLTLVGFADQMLGD